MTSANGLRPELRSNADLLAAGIVSAAAVVLALVDAPAVLRLLPALVLVLFIPGYLLAAALFPQPSLSLTERVVISIGASFALTIVGGLLLAWSPAGLTPVSWATFLAVMSLVGIVAAWWRRRRSAGFMPRIALLPVRGIDLLMLTVAALGIVGIVAATRAIASDMEEPPPAALWMLPVENGALDARVGVRAGDPGGAYTLRVTSTGQLLDEFELDLDAGETWQQVIDFTAETRERPIVARLFDADGDELRFVVLQPLMDDG